MSVLSSPLFCCATFQAGWWVFCVSLSTVLRFQRRLFWFPRVSPFSAHSATQSFIPSAKESSERLLRMYCGERESVCEDNAVFDVILMNNSVLSSNLKPALATPNQDGKLCRNAGRTRMNFATRLSPIPEIAQTN